MVVTNSRSVEAEAIDRGLASGGNQQVAAGNRLLGAGGRDGGRDRSADIGDADDIHAAADDNALALQPIKNDIDTFRIIAGERSRRLEHGH